MYKMKEIQMHHIRIHWEILRDYGFKMLAFQIVLMY